MPDPEKVATVVSEWVAKAENDLKAAGYILRLGKGCPTDTVCFHGQQVVEKYLKALLTAKGIAFPKTHNIRKLIGMLPAGARLDMAEDEQDELTDYATGARYPGWGEISLTDARRVVAIARRLRRDVRRLLPKEALYRRKLG
jgi:HEPN domain-containing protein